MTHQEITELYDNYIIRNDEDSFVKLYFYIQDNITPKIQKITGRADIAIDIIQLSWSKILKSSSSYNSSEGSFFSYFYTISKNEALKYLQKSKNEFELKAQYHEEEITKIENLEQDQLGKYLMSLPENYRDVIMLHFYYEVELKEIGRMLNVAPNTVKTRLLRGKKALKEKIKF
ncbi:RNA polymerase sigma factor [Candidatus Kapabacteria bacterium]|nr:RNA polymerase sigma factor [Candidatus Kapabacteria bacterium]